MFNSFFDKMDYFTHMENALFVASKKAADEAKIPYKIIEEKSKNNCFIPPKIVIDLEGIPKKQAELFFTLNQKYQKEEKKKINQNTLKRLLFFLSISVVGIAIPATIVHCQQEAKPLPKKMIQKNCPSLQPKKTEHIKE